MSSSIFESNLFKSIQHYDPSERKLVEPEKPEATAERREKIQNAISTVLSETKNGIEDDVAEAYQEFLEKVEIIDEEFADSNYGHPFSDSISKMREKFLVYNQEKQGKRDTVFKDTVIAIRNFNFEKGRSKENIKILEDKLVNFAKELVQERLPSFNGKEKQQAIDIAEQIKKIAAHVGSNKIQQAAEYINLKILQTHPVYQSIISGTTITFETKDVPTVADRINGVLQHAFPFLRKESIRLSKDEVETILKNLYDIDDLMIKAGATDEKSPIAETIEAFETFLEVSPRVRPLPERKEKEIVEEKPSQSQVSKLRAQFEKPQDSSPPITTSTKSEKKELTIEEKREQFTERIALRLEKLESLNPSQVSELIHDLERNRGLFLEKDQKGIDTLITGLILLKDPTAFKPSTSEGAILQRWMQLLGVYGISKESYERTFDSVQLTLVSRLRNTIKENRHSFGQVKAALDAVIPSLNRAAIVERLEGAVIQEKQSKPFNQKIALNIAQVIEHLEDFKSEARAFCEKNWAKALSTFDQKTGGKTSEVVNQLGYCNLQKKMSRIEERLIETHLKKFEPKDLLDLAVTESPQEFFMLLEARKDSETKLYEQELRKEYNRVRPFLTWIRDHATYVKSVYDQGSDIDRNMNLGTCLQNSQDRHKVLLKTPWLASDHIELGSTSKGRFNQAIFDQLPELIKKDPSNALKLYQQAYERVGLKITGTYPMNQKDKGQSIYEALHTEIGRLITEKGQSLFILGLSGVNTEGHAINIQVDPLFRFIDDNIGVIECPDAKTFQETLSSWLELAYPDLPELDLTTLATI
ncbi:MAG: hypothetical protein KDK96_11015 [Chlamydiia bacterium]|nr:hypothetical protein [Chlamydiia bacterium]